MQLSKITFAGFAISLIAACSAAPGTPTAVPGAPTAAPGTPTVTPATATATPTPAVAVTAAPTPPAGVTPAPTSGAVVDVCALLSPQDLEAATGNAYLPGLPDEFGQCYWDGDQVGGGNGGDTIVGAINVQDLAYIKSVFGDGGTDVTVSGQAAFYNPTEGLSSIWVDLGNGSLLVLSFAGSGDLDPSYQAIAQQLAEIALANM